MMIDQQGRRCQSIERVPRARWRRASGSSSPTTTWTVSRLAFSSSELMTHASIRRKDIALRYSTRPASSAPRA